METADFYAVADVNLAGEFDPSRATVLPKPDADPAMDVARRTHTFQEFLRFSQFPVWQVVAMPEPEGAKEVRLVDLRFRTFTARATVDSRLRVLNESFFFGSGRPK
ncbi:Membrane-bound metal-dependent hydrolase (fragment) [Candidatus Sulfopaludibacter sp. SbA3]